jgi:tRNA threonylcarbamoyl adenosine modification protein YeaZ
MKILAIEFCSAQRSVAIIQASSKAPHAAEASAEVVETGTRSTKALGLVEQALRIAQLERQQVECLAIGLGPGSYNGIRLAIALAQGWQLARGVKLVGISSAECLAAQAQADGIYGRVHVTIDAQRGEFYLGTYEVTVGAWRELEPLRLAPVAEVHALLQAGATLIGPDAAGALPGIRAVFPRAAMLGRLAWGRTDFLAGEAMVPIYLRQTQFVKAPPPRIMPT